METELIMKIIALIIGAEGFFKAVEYFIDKIIKASKKSEKIEDNSVNLAEFKAKTEKDIKELNEKMQDAHTYASDSLKDLEKSITTTLKEHKEEYMQRIEEVEDSITNMKAVYQQTVAVFDVKLEALTTQVEKHNSVVERMFVVEGRLNVHDEQIRVANARLKKLDGKSINTED